jgi:hypothetical protein
VPSCCAPWHSARIENHPCDSLGQPAAPISKPPLLQNWWFL